MRTIKGRTEGVKVDAWTAMAVSAAMAAQKFSFIVTPGQIRSQIRIE